MAGKLSIFGLTRQIRETYGLVARGPDPGAQRRKAMTIQDLIKTYEIALNANDLEKILTLYGSDPVFMPQHAPALVGREAVRAGYRQVFDTLKLNIRFEIHEVEEAGDGAWARTSSAGRTRILAAGIEVTEGNNELFIFRREGGEWRIHRYLFATNQPRA
ncbi:MAG: nuclear transport factor 2 family protein [Polyangiaceae bacterium]